MSRADLLALTPQSLAQLANMGLVKRAQRELDEGLGPTLVESDAGEVTGTFPDGVVAVLTPQRGLKDCACSCGATAVCRHRVAVALAYAPWHAAASAKEPASGEDSPRAERDAPPAPWSPGELTDEVLARAAGVRAFDRARVTARRGLVATVERGDVPVAKLPACTVRFLVPRELAYARCDCVDGAGACEHVALAVWAFREADRAAPGAPTAIVSLGAEEGLSAAAEGALADTLTLARDLLARGIEAFQPAPTRFAQLTARLEREGLAWVHDLVSELEIALEGYHARSALYGARELAALLAELRARTRAALADAPELPARFVLGRGEALRTELDHVRLVSLGARLRADGRARFADVFLADPDTATVLRLRKRWDPPEGAAPENGEDLGRRRITGSVSLRLLAHGQLVSKSVKRLANRSVEIGTSRATLTSVTPHAGDHAALPAPLLVRDLAEHAARTARQPPAALRPRVLAEDVHVVAISEVRGVAYSSAEQRLVATLVDEAGGPLTLTLSHRSAAPHAIDAVRAALDAGPRFVSGTLSASAGGFVLTPLSLTTDTLVVPDLAGPTKVRALPPLAQGHGSSPLEEALTAAESALEELCSVGLGAATPGALARLRRAAGQLDDAGLAGLARRALRVVEKIAAGATAEAADAWLDATARLALTREAASRWREAPEGACP